MLRSLENQRGLTLIELMIVVFIIGLLSLLVFPNYLRYQHKSGQAEAKANLGGIFVAQRAFSGESLRFGGFPQIGFSLAGQTNRYTYRSVSTDSAGAASPQVDDMIAPSGWPVAPENTTYAAASSLQGFTATATANIDKDPTVDQWYVNDLKANLHQPTTNDILL